MTDKNKDPADVAPSGEVGKPDHQQYSTTAPVRQRHAELFSMYNYAVGRRRALARLEFDTYARENAERMRHGQGRKSRGLQ